MSDYEELKALLTEDILNRVDGAGSDLRVAEDEGDGTFIRVSGGLDVSALTSTVISWLEKRGKPVGVQTWDHQRKGRITGRMVWEDSVWTDIQLVGDHKLRYGSSDLRGTVDRDGEVIRVRKSLLRAVE